jgi:hypothetical protein
MVLVHPSLLNKSIIVGSAAAVCCAAAVSSSTSTICPFRLVTGWYCPLCGISRAMLSLVKLNFVEAFQYNWLVFPLAVAVLMWLFFSKKYMFLKNFFKKLYTNNLIIKYSGMAMLGSILIINWVLRNIPATGLDYLAKR